MAFKPSITRPKVTQCPAGLADREPLPVNPGDAVSLPAGGPPAAMQADRLGFGHESYFGAELDGKA
jgi:hypothetical protein